MIVDLRNQVLVWCAFWLVIGVVLAGVRTAQLLGPIGQMWLLLELLFGWWAWWRA